jgi:predicted transcriptional regulator
MHSARKNKKGRFSSEYTMLSILEYLYVNARRTPVSKYNIVTNTPGIRQQRADRVNLMMDSLEKNEYIISEYTSSNITFYKITQKGIDEYEKWIKNFFLTLLEAQTLLVALIVNLKVETMRVLHNESVNMTLNRGCLLWFFWGRWKY